MSFLLYQNHPDIFLQRLAQIGLKGELFIMDSEKNKLKQAGITDTYYPKHVALESMSSGYDVASIDENGNKIFIEVKTTTRRKEDINSKIFFISSNELVGAKLSKRHNPKREIKAEITNFTSLTNRTQVSGWHFNILQ